jgi:tetratricopeptide (TPR) repeat protein
MNRSALIDRIQILFSQNRTKEAKTLLQSFLENNPDDYMARFFLAHVYLAEGENDKCRLLVDMLQEEEADDMDVLQLSTRVDLADEYYTKAESKCEILIESAPEESEAYMLMSQILIGQRRYDKAKYYIDKALEFDAENVEALNIKIHIDKYLGVEQTESTVKHALDIDPENPFTIANHGLQLLNDGKQKEAMDRIKVALDIDPNNPIAQYAMVEALKSRFWIYRMFYKYKVMTARLTANGSWGFIIGIYIAYRILHNVADKNPDWQFILYPLVYFIAFLFLMTWLVDAFMNMYLLTNKYGQALLSAEQKKSAQYCAIAFFVAIMMGVSYWMFGTDQLLYGTIMSIALMIPLASFLHPVKESNKTTTKYYTIALIGIALMAFIFNSGALFSLFALAVFAYQWVINGILIKENARVMD